MQLRSKLFLLQLPLALALVVLAGLTFRIVAELDTQAGLILRRNYAHKNSIHRLQVELARLGAGADTQAAPMTLSPALYAVLDGEVQLHEREPLDDAEPAMAAALRNAFREYSAVLERFARTSAASERKAQLAALQASWDRTTTAAEALWIHHDANMLARAEAQTALAGRLRAIASIAFLGALLAAIAVSTVYAGRLTRPIAALSAAARRVNKKDFTTKLDVTGDDELAGLARDFTHMSEELARFEALSVDDLVRARQALQAAVDSLVDPVLVFGADIDTLALCNQAAGAKLQLFTGGDLAPLAGVSKLQALVRNLRHAALCGEPHVPTSFDEAVPAESASGELWYLARAMPIAHADGHTVGASLMLQDVTRFRRIDELRNDMVSTVAHELKTPLTSLQMAIGLCEEQIAGPVTPKQAELLRTAREDTTRLQNMVAELLDLARLQAGRMVLDLVAEDVSSLVADAMAPFEATASSKGVGLVMAAEGELPSIRCDAERVKIVFANLISNAIRYTPSGGQVTVHARLEGEAVAFAVEDTGAGIPADQRAHVFDKFFRVPGSPKGGAGLGLWITREIVQAHGGAISVSDKGSAGTRVAFTLPVVSRMLRG